jgi:hypothetical protein
MTPFILNIKSNAPTTVSFLHIQGYVPYRSVIPTWIVMSHTVVLNLHIKSYPPTIITLFSKPILQRLQSESVQINTK